MGAARVGLPHCGIGTGLKGVAASDRVTLATIGWGLDGRQPWRRTVQWPSWPATADPYQFGGADGLAHVALGVLGYVDEQTDYGC